MNENKSIIPIFSTHYSMGGGGILTCEEKGKTAPGEPISIFDIAHTNKLSELVLVEERIDGFIEAYKNSTKQGIKLIYGLKLVVCADMTDKSDASLLTESKVIVFIKNSQGYNDLLRIQSRAWTDGFYYTGRIDWKTLKTFWTENLILSLPFFSSFIAKNTLTFAKIVPDLPVPVTEIQVLREVNSGLPFAPLIEGAIDNFVGEDKGNIIDCKSIYYEKYADLKSMMVYRCILGRTKLNKPNLDHFSSCNFSFEDYLNLILRDIPKF